MVTYLKTASDGRGTAKSEWALMTGQVGVQDLMGDKDENRVVVDGTVD